ncbi:MAG: LIC12192 family sporadic carbohydrate cluster protein [Bdellovibrionota bacterium]
MSSTASARNVLQGYVVNVAFGNLRVPAPMQNLMLRDYAAKNNLMFKLSVGEYSFPGCYLQLEGLYPLLRTIEGIGMCSMFMLPKHEERRRLVYQKCIEAGAAIHLLLEKVVIRDWTTVERVEDVLRFHRAIAQSPTTIPTELLPKLPVPDCFT